MKSYHANKGAGLASLTVKEHDIPVPGPHEVLVRVQAASLNYRDLAILSGTYPLPIKLDGIPLADGAGSVVAPGSGASPGQTWGRDGGTPPPQRDYGPFSGWGPVAQT